MPYKNKKKQRAAQRRWIENLSADARQHRLEQNNVRVRRWRARDDGTASRDFHRQDEARRGGYAPPPRESDCPPRPLDNRCQCCEEAITYRLLLDHDHETGMFRGWVCRPCNTG